MRPRCRAPYGPLARCEPQNRLGPSGNYQYGYNGHADCNAIAALGVKVLNLHQGVDLNPYINYPFEHAAMEKQSNFSRWCKSLGVESVKVGPAKSS